MLVSDTVLNTGAALFGVDPASLQSMGGTDGAVYACRKGSHAFVLKFIPAREEQIPVYDEKLAFQCYLAEHNVPLVLPEPSLSGKVFEYIAGESASYITALTPRASGRHPQPRNLYDWNENLFSAWGQLLGKMHFLTRQYPRWEKPAGEPPPDSPIFTRLMDWQAEHCSFCEWCKEPGIVKKWQALYAPLNALPRDRNSYGLIHNDLHQWNFLYHPDAQGKFPITIIDFDVCAYHWFITDIAIALYHAMTEGAPKSMAERQSYARSFLPPFLKGYRQENELDSCWLEKLPLFLKYREILVYIALSNSWPKETRNRWQSAFLATKRSRTLRDEPILEAI